MAARGVPLTAVGSVPGTQAPNCGGGAGFEEECEETQLLDN